MNTQINKVMTPEQEEMIRLDQNQEALGKDLEYLGKVIDLLLESPSLEHFKKSVNDYIKNSDHHEEMFDDN